MLIVQTDKDPATAGWLTWLPLAPFANGYGGRKLGDDVVDLALLAVFGDPFGADPDGSGGQGRPDHGQRRHGLPVSVRPSPTSESQIEPATGTPQARARRGAPRRGGRGLRAERPMGTSRGVGTARLGESEVLELDLAFFEARVARDSFAARDHAQLARLHLQRAPVGRHGGRGPGTGGGPRQALAGPPHRPQRRGASESSPPRSWASIDSLEARAAGGAAAGAWTRPPGRRASLLGRDPDRARSLHGGRPHFRHPAHGAQRARRSLRGTPGGRRSVVGPLRRGSSCATR